MMNVARVVSRTIGVHFISDSLKLPVRRYSTKNFLTNWGKVPGYSVNSAKADNERFLKSFPRIVSALTSSNEDLKGFYQRFEKVLEGTVPNEIMMYGLMAPNTYKLLHKNPNSMSDEEVFLSQVVGWAYEFVRAAVIMIDDLVDNGETRCGGPCWYRNSDVGLHAAVDAFSVYSHLFKLIKIHFHDKPYYLQLIELLQQYGVETFIGQSIDFQIISKFRRTRSFEEFTFKNHYLITDVNLTYLVYGPIAGPMLMHGIEDPVAYAQAKHVSTLMAQLATHINDVWDVYGDVTEVGKIPVDIRGGKCAWPILAALQICNSEQKKMLQENYGKPDKECIERVNNLFIELRLDDVFNKHAKASYEHILKIIEGPDFKLPPGIFTYYLDFILGRN